MTTAYRTPAIAVPAAAAAAEPTFGHAGPLATCPYCGWSTTEYVVSESMWRFDGKAHLRAREGPHGLFARCRIPGPHVHQACRRCRGAWTTAPRGVR